MGSWQAGFVRGKNGYGCRFTQEMFGMARGMIARGLALPGDIARIGGLREVRRTIGAMVQGCARQSLADRINHKIAAGRFPVIRRRGRGYWTTTC